MKIHFLYHPFILHEYLSSAWTLYNTEKMSSQVHDCSLQSLQIVSPLNAEHMQLERNAI